MLHHTPLTPYFKNNGIKCVPYAGFEMPLQFAGVLAEHAACRSEAVQFDVSHMGQICFSGPEAQSFLDHALSNKVTRCAVHKAQYNIICDADGNVVDDSILYRIDTEKYLLVTNASNHIKDLNHFLNLKQNINSPVTIEDVSDHYALIALQGPRSIEKLLQISDITFSQPIGKKMSLTFAEFQKTQLIVARTGYTGEDGVELFCSPTVAISLWKKLEEQGVQSAGLASRDLLRLEAAFPLYGNEFLPTLSPLGCRMDWAIDFEKEFNGKVAMSEQKKAQAFPKLILLKSTSPQIFRSGYKVFQNDIAVGEITSGSHSPSVGAPIAIARIQSGIEAKNLTVEVRQHKVPADVVSQFLTKPKESL